ncbi:MAG: hypothetical protein GY757_52750 [bacterium]|nr:hypothetical protein [bacterium]
MNDDIKQLNEKLDFLTGQVTGITSRVKAFDELKEDVALFSSDAFTEVVNFMAEVNGQFKRDDFLLFTRQLLRNVKNMSNMMAQLESISELMEDVSPLAKEMFYEVVEKFEQFEKANMFKALESVMNSVGKLYESFTPEEIDQMVENHVRLIKLSSRLVTPANLDKLEAVVDEVENMDNRQKEKVSLLKIMKKARSQDVLQSLDMMLDVAAKLSK